MRSTSIAGPVEFVHLGPLDPRETAWRPDMADIALAERIAAPHYVAPTGRHVTAMRALLYREPDPDAPVISELLFGEEFALLDTIDGFGWGYSVADHYVGYVAADALAIGDDNGRRRLAPYDTPLLAAPDIKARVLGILPVGARIAPQGEDGGFTSIGSGWVATRSLTAAATSDWVAIAEGFLGSPYRWGGRSRAGIDCSGLVQVARQVAGFPCRRDSDMQIADCAAIDPAADALRRGDLVAWPGHIGILLSADRLLHANAFHMACVAEPLAEAIARIGTPRFGRP